MTRALQQVVYEAQTSFTEQLGTHAGVEGELRPSIGDLRGLVIVAQGRRVDLLLEALPYQLRPLLQAEGRLLD